MAKKINDKLTPKENYLRLCRGEEIEYIPTQTYFGASINGEQPIAPTGLCGPGMMYREEFGSGTETFHDDWGVEYISVPSANGGFMPMGTHTNEYLIKDIYKWRDYIDKPCLYDNIDWERKAQSDLAKIDREQTAVVVGSPLQPFQQLMAMIGFVDGLVALYEEPEIMEEILDYMITYIEPHIQANIDYYNPDLFVILDDTATQRVPFISVDMFRELLMPAYRRIAKAATDRGIPLLYHNCGNCQAFMPDMIDLGVRYWEPAQTTNDLDTIQKTLCPQYNFNVVGGFDWVEPEVELTEDYTRQLMRDYINRWAPGGHFITAAGIIGPLGDKRTAQINEWLTDESYTYRREWIKKQG
ncbi:MAG: hypothetical protein IJ017_04650 [Oscillospiraceae bacterium]|nr:hypothetical protein [Oscillospiraceae bacterium]